MIERLKVKGLNNQFDYDMKFNEDLNIFTGANGCGKTTLLKLIWYLISGNFVRIISEIPFEFIYIRTDEFYLAIRKNLTEQEKIKKYKSYRSSSDIDPFSDRKSVFVIRWKFDEKKEEERRETIEIDMYNNKWFDSLVDSLSSPMLGGLSLRILSSVRDSLFFPSFRRIEGGFSKISGYGVADDSASSRSDNLTDDLEHAMSQMSTKLSTLAESYSHPTMADLYSNHSFISSISTHDIVELLTQTYADVSQKTNDLQVELSEEITQEIEAYQAGGVSEPQKLEDAISLLDDIKKSINQVTEQRDSFFKPFSVLSDLISQIFGGRGIRVTEEITLGDAEEALSSDKLSAGEKQMLSFLCYNTFNKNITIFIDEPESSLHVDWQRLLLPTLLKQETENQFFVATHSPFIYARYPDKEFLLDNDRGGEMLDDEGEEKSNAK